MGAVVSRISNSQREQELMAIAYEEVEAERTKNEAAQQKAIRHVVSNIFAYAPVRIKLARYPKASARAGEAFVWVTLDPVAIAKQERMLRQTTGKPDAKVDLPRNCPAGAAIDKRGNIFISATESQASRRITGKDLKYSFDIPPQPDPPSHFASTPSSIELRWGALEDDASAVELYELQFRPAAAPENALWRTFTRCSEPSATMGGLGCAESYVFRVRAQNGVGWSAWSDASDPYATSADVPATPLAPCPGTIAAHYVPVYWAPADGRGLPVDRYVLSIKAPGESWADIYDGPGIDHVVDGLEAGASYLFRVQACNAMGRSAFSANTVVTTATEHTPGRAELPSGATALRDGANHWIECWNRQEERCFYFNRVTGERRDEQPAEFTGEEAGGGGDGQDGVGASSSSSSSSLNAVVAAQRAAHEAVVEFRKKRYRMLRKLRGRGAGGGAQRGGRDKLLTLDVRRRSVVRQSFVRFRKLGADELRQRLRVDFEDEMGIDSGGLTKDWFMEMSKGLLNKKLGMLRELEDGTYEVDPDSGRKNAGHLSWFRFLGKVMGKAIFDRQVLDMNLNRVLLLHMLRMPVSLEDLERLDPVYAKSLLWMRDNDITDILFETFSVDTADNGVDDGGNSATDAYSEDTIVDLVEDGRNKDVTEENKEEYIALMTAWRTEFCVRPQLDALLQGFNMLVPEDAIAEFTLEEFQQLLNGLPDLDVDDLRATVVFQGGYDADSQEVLWLWQALRGFTPQRRSQWLRFATGASKVPVDGFDPPVNITKGEDGSDSLPKAHTCFNQFVLPQYTSFEQFVAKLCYALDNAQGFELA